MTSGIINGQNIETMYMDKHVITKITFSAWHALGTSCILHMNI